MVEKQTSDRPDTPAHILSIKHWCKQKGNRKRLVRYSSIKREALNTMGIFCFVYTFEVLIGIGGPNIFCAVELFQSAVSGQIR